MTEEYIPRGKSNVDDIMPRAPRQLEILVKIEKLLKQHDGYDPKSDLTRRGTALRIWRETRR